jgi:hypothetical protein
MIKVAYLGNKEYDNMKLPKAYHQYFSEKKKVVQEITLIPGF